MTDAKVISGGTQGLPLSGLVVLEFTKKLIPQTNEAYTLTVTADDGVRLWFNGILAVDKWILQSGATSYLWTTPILEAGKPYKVVLEHFEKTGGEQLKLEWSSSSVPKQVIPESQVFANYSNFTRLSNGYNLESPKVGFNTPRFVGNLAYGKVGSNSPNSTVKPGTSQNSLTDGDLTAMNYVELQPTDGQAVYAQVDLGSVKSVSKLAAWHYYEDGRTYHGTKTQVSADGVNWITVFDSAISGEYPESENGNVISLSPAMNIQYIRDYLFGNTANQYNHWVDIQAFDSYGQALLLEEGSTNKTSTEGSGASTDWTKWSHWGNHSYWSSESQSSDPVLGNVYSGVTASTTPYLFDYFPYTVNASNTYTFSVMLKAAGNLNNVTLKGYINQGSNNVELTNGVVTKTGVNLTQNWQTFTFTITPTSNPSGGAGLGIQISNLSSTGITIFAARPQFEQKAYATSYTDSSRAEESLAINSSVLNQSEGTIEVRVYVNANIKNTLTNRYIFSYEPIDSPSYLSVLSLRHTMSNRWSVWTTNSSGISSEVYINDTLAQGWHTFAVRWSASELALFIDGQKQASAANPMLPTISGGSLSLGKWLYNSLRNINTQIDDLRISSRARTDAEISSAYSGGQPLTADSNTTYMMDFEGDLSSTQWAAEQWIVANDPGSVAALSFDPSTNYFGNQALKLEKLNQTTRSYSQQTVKLVPGKTYTLTSWLKSQNVGSSANQGAYLFIRYQDASGNWVEADSDLVNGTQAWQRMVKSFTLPSSMLTEDVVIGLALAQSTGTAWFDGVQLEEGSSVHDNNLVNNNSLDLWANGTIYGWTKTPGVYQETLASNVKAGTTSVKINHDTKAEWQGVTSQRIPVKSGDDLNLSAYVKSAGFIPNGNQDLWLRFFASDNSTLIAQDGPTIPGGSYDWVRIAKTVKVPQGAYFVELAAQIKSSQVATVWLDGVQLQYGNISTNYSYDPYNNQTEEVNQQGDAVTYQYDWYGNLVSQSSAIALNENLISNSSFETLDASQNALNWQSTGNLPTEVSAGVERNPGGTYTRTSEALNEDGIRISSGSARFSSNLAYHAAVSKSPNATLASNSYLETVTDGSVNLTRYTELYTSDNQSVYLQVDLGSLKNLSSINVRHYYGDARKYRNTKTQISADNVNWITVFDSALAGEYIETPEGHLITLPAGTNARYIRDYVKGNTTNPGNHWIEIQAYDVTGQAVMIEEGSTNLLTNPIFSNGLINWTTYGSPSIVETSPRYNSFGNNSIHVVANAAYQGISQSISLSSGVEYAQTARIYIVSGLVRVTHSGTDYYYNKTSGENGWVTLVNKIDVIAPRTNNFTVYSYNGAAEFYVDVVQLEQKSYSTSFTDATRSDETLTIPVSAFTPSQGTLEAWVKPARNSQTAIQVIMDIAETGSNGLILAVATDGRFYLQAGTGSGVIQAYSTTVAQKDTWYHIAGKWDSTGVSLYVNGVKQAFTPGTVNIQLNVTPTIGRQSTVAQRWLDGWIGDLRVSSTSRTDQEILASYTGGQPIAQDQDTTYKMSMDGHFQPTANYYGQNTLKVNVSTTAPVGDYGMLSKSMTVISNSTYTLSAILRGRTIQDGSGAFLQVQFYNAQDQLIGQTNGQALSGSFDWQKSFMTFDTPKESAKVKVALILSGHGSAWFDAILLERGSSVSKYNIIENPSMEMGTNSVDAWTSASFSGSAYPAWTSATAKEGSKSLSLYSSSGVDGDWRQIISVKPNTTYTFTGWVKTQDLQQLDAQVFGTYYLVESDSNSNIMTMHRTLGNNLGTNDWKRVLYTFTTSPSTVTLRIGASLGNWGQAKGMAWFDGVRLFEGRITDTYLYDEARNFPTNHLDAQGHPSAVTYDLLGNKITETNALGNTATYAYDRFSRLLSVTDALSNTMTFSYDVNGNKTRERDALGNTTSYQYDLFDRLVRVTKPDGSFVTYNYDAIGNRVRTIDALGNIYRYKYDGQSKLVTQISPLGEITTSAYDSVGNLITVTNAKGDTTSYSYDRLNRLIQVSDPLNHTVNYTYNPKGNLLTKTDSNGNTLKYVYDYSGKLTQEIDALGNASSFIYDEAGHVIRKINAGGQSTDLSYGSLGRLSSEKDALGGVKSYTYDVLGNLIKATDQNGNSTTFNYDVLKRLTGTTDALGNTVNYTYDANSNRLTIRDARGNLTTYTYDGSNRPTSVQDPLNNLVSYTYDFNNNQTSVQDGRGNTTSYAYDPLNRVLSVTDALNGVTTFSYDAVGNRVTVTDPNGNTTTNTYDEANRLTKVTDALGNFTSYQYDANGNLLQETTPNGGVITSTYNGNNWLISVKDPLNNTESYTYDNLGNRLTTTDRRGNVTTYTYDALNRVTKGSNNVTGPTGLVSVETSYTYEAVGNRLTQTDPNGEITLYAYDKLNRLTSVTDALAGTTTYGYDGNGNKISLIDPMGYTYSYLYDELNRLSSATNPLNGVTSMTYDANSNRLTVTDPNNHTTAYVYDKLNRLTSETNSEGEITSITYDGNGNQLTITDGNTNTTTYLYNALNQVTKVTTPQGATNTYTYDKNGNRLTVKDSYLNQTTYTYNLNNQVLTVKDELNNVTTNTYDGNGNTLTVMNPLNKVTSYSYDELNRIITVTDPLNNVTTYEYDLNSNRTAVVDAEGGRTTYTYDELNRLKTVTNQIGDTKGYTYDKNVNVLTFTDGNAAVTTYVYDHLNRQTSINYPNATSVSYTYDSVGNRLSMTDSTGTTTYAYDNVNRLLTETNPAQKVNSYAYDNVGNILQKIIDGVTQTFTYDKDNHLKTIARNGTPLASYVYDLSGNVVQVSYENGVSTNYIYDDLNRIQQVRTTKGSGAVLSNLTYTYDGAGRKATETDQVSGQTTTYHYNNGGWLDVITTPTGQTTYSYDQNGNMLTKTDVSGTTNYLYNQASELIQMSSPGQVVTFLYDKNGNQTKRTEGTNITNYAYTPGGKLASITNPDGSTISYTYDGDGRQVSQTAGGVTTKLYYDGLLVAKETDVNGVVKAEYLYGLGGAPIKMIRDGVSYYYIYNGHGDTIALTNSSGTVVASHRYDPWGKVTVLTGSTIKNPFLYAGQFGIYHDSGSGLDLMMTRYYNSSINRFMSPDEFPGIVAKPISHNAYAYVHNDPINNVDPDGHWPKWVSNAWNSVTSFVSNVASTVWNAVESAASRAWNQVIKTYNKVVSAIKKTYAAVKYVVKHPKETYNQVKRKINDKLEKAAKEKAAREEEKRRVEEEKKRVLEEKKAEAKAAFENEDTERAEESQRRFELSQGISQMNCLTMGTLTPEQAQANRNATVAAIRDLLVPDPNSALEVTLMQLEQSGSPLALGGMAGLILKRGGTKLGRQIIKEGDEVVESLLKGSGNAENTLYHYTNEAGLEGITSSKSLNPSLKSVNPNDVRYGNGQYLSDIVPGTKTPAQLSRQFINNPFQGQRYTHYVEIDVNGLNVVKGRDGVFVVPNETTLDLVGRIVGSGNVK